MASTAVTVRDTFSVGMFGSKDGDKKASGGTILGALGGIQGTLNTLVGLTKESLNIDKKDQLLDKTELRDEKIKAGETDLPPEIKDTDKGPGILGSLKGAAGSLWAGMGAKTAFALVVGGLALLTKFSDQLVGPLTKLLEWIRDDMVPDIQELWKDVKGWWKESWKSVKEFFKTAKAIFTTMGEYTKAIQEWYKSIIPEGVSYEDEFGRMHTRRANFGENLNKIATDISEAVSKYVSDLFIGIVHSVGGFLLGAAMMGLAFSMGKKAILASGLFSTVTKAAVGPHMPLGAKIKAMKVGAGGYIAIGLMAANAIIETVAATQRAFAAATEDDINKIDKSKFASSWLAGGAKGGWTNAFANLKEKAGIGGICMEDKTFPKQNSLFKDGKQVLISKRDFVAKLVAAKNAKKSDDFMIIGRVEALIAGMGIEEALDRASAYEKAGANVIFVHSRKESPDEIFEFLKLWKGKIPIMIVPTAFPTVTLDELKSHGVGMVVFAHQTTLAAFAAIADVVKQLSKISRLSELNTKMASMEDLFKLQGMQKINDHESFVEEEIKKLDLD